MTARTSAWRPSWCWWPSWPPRSWLRSSRRRRWSSTRRSPSCRSGSRRGSRLQSAPRSRFVVLDNNFSRYFLLCAGDTMHMHYRGTLLADGSKFDRSLDRGGSSDAVSVLTKPDVLCCSEVASEEAIIFCRNKLLPTPKIWMLLCPNCLLPSVLRLWKDNLWTRVPIISD